VTKTQNVGGRFTSPCQVGPLHHTVMQCFLRGIRYLMVQGLET